MHSGSDRVQKESDDEEDGDSVSSDEDDRKACPARDDHHSSSEDEDGEEKLTFQEKKPLQEDVAVAPGSFKGFSFKKKETARPPMKQRTLKW